VRADLFLADEQTDGQADRHDEALVGIIVSSITERNSLLRHITQDEFVFSVLIFNVGVQESMQITAKLPLTSC
jgi:hypothetical protein